jgi:hypothetical protein
MSAIEITSNVLDVHAHLADLIREQMPFATSKAVNDLTLEARDHLRGRVETSFIIRRPWVTARGAFPVTLSKKRDEVKRGTIRLDTSRDFLGKFEQGGTKQSRTGVKLAVPIEARPTARSVVPKRLSVRNLNLRATRTATGKVQLKGLQRTFVVKTGGASLILQRQGRGVVRTLYAFKRSVPIPDSLHFYDTIASYVRNEWNTVAGEALRYALLNAKRR